MLHYLVELLDTAGHYIDVSVQLNTTPDHWKLEQTRKTLSFNLPTWIPGSYLIREFSKNVLYVTAQINGEPVSVLKTRKDRWAVELPVEFEDIENLVVQAKWRVYAWDLSVRSAHVDRTHAFFNGTSLFLLPDGFDDSPAKLTIQRGEGDLKPWRFACGLRRIGPNGSVCSTPFKQGCETLQPGDRIELFASNYDELIDHPVEMGELTVHSFEACGVPHHFAVYGADSDLDLARLCSDLKPVLEAQIGLFEPESLEAPFEAYWFLLHATDDGYGGLEHRNSTALVCSRKDLPQIGVKNPPEGYDTLMGLCSHEYFHSWNVKRIKPAMFTPYDLSTEGYTRLLWVFEGFTSYYDDLMLARAGYYTEEAYLKALAKSASQVLRNPGRHVQPVAESSFEAWTKYYRQDENAPNAIVSYYTKGALVALCIDIRIRQLTDGEKCLDDVMRYLWEQHGKTGIGVPENSMPEIVHAATGVDIARELDRWVNSTDELPLAEYLGWLGFALEAEEKDSDALVSIGANVSFGSDGMRLKQVLNGGPAHLAGLSAGDNIIALDYHKTTKEHFERRLRSLQPGSQVVAHAFRAMRMFETIVTLQARMPQSWKISRLDMPNPSLKTPWE